jgi:tellurite resistance protein
MTNARSKFPLVPASFFGMVLGLIGLGNSWRAASAVWGLPAEIGEAAMLAGVAVWALLFLLFAAKWAWAREDARAEARHPVQCCFIGLAGVATMLVAVAILPYSRALAVNLFGVGAAFTLGFALWRTGGLWQGGRDPATSTPVLYLPTVAGSFVTAIALAAFGYPEWGRLALGAGVFSWLAIESVLVQRLYTSPEIPAPLRPTLGIQLAPPTVGLVAYVSLTPGPPDTVSYALIGYGLLQLLVLVRLSAWIFAAGITVSAWSFSFGLTALATALVKLAGRSSAGPVAMLAPAVFVIVSLALAVLIVRTLWLLASGRLLPAAAPAAAAAPLP